MPNKKSHFLVTQKLPKQKEWTEWRWESLEGERLEKQSGESSSVVLLWGSCGVRAAVPLLYILRGSRSLCNFGKHLWRHGVCRASALVNTRFAQSTCECWHLHFHCDTASAQHEVATKSATHVTLIRGQPCSVAVALKEICDPRSLWDQTTAMLCSSGCWE